MNIDFIQAHVINLVLTYVPKILLVLVLLFLSWILAGWLSSVIKRVLRKAKIDETLTLFISKSIRWVVLVIAILSCLSVFGVQSTSFAAVIGATGLAIGLAFQGTLSNIAAGLMLLFFRPFKVKDVVVLDSHTGTIREIGLFTTVMDTVDNRRVIIPNSRIFGSTIENITYNLYRRVDVNLKTEYDTDMTKTREVLQNVVSSLGIKKDGYKSEVFLKSLDDDSVNWQLRVWCKTSDYGSVLQRTIQTGKEALDIAQISIHSSQLSVKLVKD